MKMNVIERNGVKCELYNCDCRNVLPRMVDAIITDHPYGLSEKMQGGTWGKTRKELMNWDTVPEVEIVLGILSLAPIVVIFGGNYYQLPCSRGWLSWFKPDAPKTMANFELAWTNQDQNSRQISWSIAATNSERCGHPTQKPVRVMAWCMDEVGVKTGETVMDPFMGSGSTGVACLRTGRNFIGIEKDPKHFATAVERIQREANQGVLI